MPFPKFRYLWSIVRLTTRIIIFRPPVSVSQTSKKDVEAARVFTSLGVSQRLHRITWLLNPTLIKERVEESYN